MISLRPSGPEPERHQHRPPQGSHAGLALQHHAVQHQHRIAVRERPGMKRGHRGIQCLGHPAHGAGTDRLAQHRQQRLGHLAGRQTQQKAGQDHAIDMLGPPGIGLHHGDRIEPPGARHLQLDPAELGQQVAHITAIAPISRPGGGDLRQVPIDPQGHLPLQDLGQRQPAGRAIILAPIVALQLHCLDHLERPRQALDRRRLWHRGTPSQGLSLILGVPLSSALTQNLIHHHWRVTVAYTARLCYHCWCMRGTSGESQMNQRGA